VTPSAPVQIELHLFATLAGYLPRGAVDGSARITLARPMTAEQLVHSLGIPDELPCMVLINGVDAVPGEAPLRDGDVVSIFPPLAGGAPLTAPSSPNDTLGRVRLPILRGVRR
jgi:sulfur carrier protein ThiS